MPVVPLYESLHESFKRNDEVGKPTDSSGLILEAWAEGYLVGSLIIMAAITVANMRRGILLHKLILIELILGCFMGTFIFPSGKVYSWYLSATAIPLNISWCMHNVISWMKIKPFLSKTWSRVFIITVCLSFPYWVVEIYANFAFFNGMNKIFQTTRPYEALFRDPWWIFTTAYLFYQIAAHYRIRLTSLVFISPRFGVLLVAMVLSIIFIILDILSVTDVLGHALPDGLNPFWKLSTVFKCLTDSIVLDDFKTALDRLMRHKMRRDGLLRQGLQPDMTYGATGHSTPPISPRTSAGPARDAYSSWAFAADNKMLSNEDPLGEENRERRITDDLGQPMSPMSEVFRQRTLSGTTRAGSDNPLLGDGSSAGHNRGSDISTMPPLPPAHFSRGSTAGLMDVLAEGPPGRPH